MFGTYSGKAHLAYQVIETASSHCRHIAVGIFLTDGLILTESRFWVEGLSCLDGLNFEKNGPGYPFPGASTPAKLLNLPCLSVFSEKPTYHNQYLRRPSTTAVTLQWEYF